MEEVSKKKKKVNYEILIGLLLLIAAAVFIIIFLVNGQTKVTGEFPEDEFMISTSCEADNVVYPFFKNNSSKEKASIKIVSNDKKIDTLSLVYYLYYDTEDEITKSRDENHYAMNVSFDQAGLEPDALGANYSRLADSFKFSLFAKANILNSKTAKFFLLDGIDGNDGLKYDTAVSMYKSQGFKCTENKNNNN